MGNLGPDHVDPVGRDLLIMKFCELFGSGVALHSSGLAMLGGCCIRGCDQP